MSGNSADDIFSCDIEPHHPIIRKRDFLTTELLTGTTDAFTVTNPPFGRNNSLSVPFFNKSAQYSEFIVFIVPWSWRKWSVQNKLDRRFHLVADHNLGINYVNVDGKPISKNSDLRTCVQYWRRSNDKPRPLYKVKDLGVIEKCKPEEADVSLTVFGYGCGAVKTEFPKVPNTTQMFLKLRHPKALEALKTVNFAKFYMNTAYTEALSFPEINYLLNYKIFGDPYIITE